MDKLKTGNGVPFLDLKAQYKAIKAETIEKLNEVLNTQNLILGPQVEELEKTIAGYCGSKFAVGVGSGTDALLLSLMAFDIGPGDEVITTPYTFFSTASSISRLGARPVFADIDIDTFNINPDLIAKKINKNTKAIIPVHLFGQCSDMEPILQIAKKYNLNVIEDAAQAIGAAYMTKSDKWPVTSINLSSLKENTGGSNQQESGKRSNSLTTEHRPLPTNQASPNILRRACSLGDAGCLSFYPTKNLGCFGEGGMITTDDEAVAKKLKALRAHGSEKRYYHPMVGINSRLDTVQAVVLLVKFKYLEEWTKTRRERAQIYEENLKGIVKIPYCLDGNYHVYNQYVIRSEKRQVIEEIFIKEKIGYGKYYPLPLHLQKCYEKLRYKAGDFPNAELAAEETLALPIYPELTREQQEMVIQAIKKALH